MPRADGRLEPGQPLRGAISARAWNRAQDAADLVLGANAGTVGDAQKYPVARNFVYVKLSQSFAPLDFVAVENSGNPPVAISLPAFNSEIVIGNAVPINGITVAPWSPGKCGMILQGGDAGSIVPIQLSGPVFARIIMRHKYHNYVRFFGTPYTNQQSGTIYFESHVCGQLRIAWWDNRNYSGAYVYGDGNQNIADAVVVL
jgi:hypothetical protein